MLHRASADQAVADTLAGLSPTLRASFLFFYLVTAPNFCQPPIVSFLNMLVTAVSDCQYWSCEIGGYLKAAPKDRNLPPTVSTTYCCGVSLVEVLEGLRGTPSF